MAFRRSRYIAGLFLVLSRLPLFLIAEPNFKPDLKEPRAAASIKRSACILTPQEHEQNLSFKDDAALYAIYAVLSNNAYAGRQLPLPKEWRPKLYKPLGTGTGFAMKVFERVVHGKVTEVVIAFRGTDEASDWWKQNLFPLFRTQFTPARKNFEEIVKLYKGENVRFVATGHSLGGGLALHLSFRYPNVSAVAFNSSPVASPGLKPRLNSRVNIWENNEALSLFRAIIRSRWPRTKQVVFNFDRSIRVTHAIEKHRIYALALNMLKLGQHASGAPPWITPLLRANCN